jgi:hypothetical protein
MRENLGYVVYLIAAIGLLWLARDALHGWTAVGVVAAILTIYITALVDGARIQRDADAKAKRRANTDF